jgi:hypothetical protein
LNRLTGNKKKLMKRENRQSALTRAKEKLLHLEAQQSRSLKEV